MLRCAIKRNMNMRPSANYSKASRPSLSLIATICQPRDWSLICHLHCLFTFFLFFRGTSEWNFVVSCRSLHVFLNDSWSIDTFWQIMSMQTQIFRMVAYWDEPFKIFHLFTSQGLKTFINPPVSQQKPVFHFTGYAGGQQMKQIMRQSISKSGLSIFGSTK